MTIIFVQVEDLVVQGAASVVKMDTLQENVPAEEAAEGVVGVAEVATSVARKGTLPENAPVEVVVAVAEAATSAEKKGTLLGSAPTQVAEEEGEPEMEDLVGASVGGLVEPKMEMEVIQVGAALLGVEDLVGDLAGGLVEPKVEMEVTQEGAMLPGVEDLAVVSGMMLGPEVAADAVSVEKKATLPASVLTEVLEVRFVVVVF